MGYGEMGSGLGKWRLLASALPLAALALAGCNAETTAAAKPPSATAQVKGFTDPAITGTVTFATLADGAILVQADVAGLKHGQAYAVHIHEKGNCSAPDSSGAHFRTGAEGHGNPFNADGSHHDGDLPSLQVDSLGVGHFDLRTVSLGLTAGARNAVVRAVIVHTGPDDFRTQPTGNSGARIACGVIAAD